MKSSIAVAGIALSLAFAPSVASASPITFSGTSGARSASVTFDTSGTNLIVTLSNTATADALVPTDILTGVFFDINGVGALGRVSAILAAGSVVNFGGTDPGGSVGGEWAYKSALAGAPLGATEGISSSGLNLFGAADRFGGTNLQGPPSGSLGGVEYGITTQGDNPLTAQGNGGINGKGLIQYQVVFTLSGLPVGFDPSAVGAITNLTAQYGTALTEPELEITRHIAAVPEPASLVLLGGGLSVLVARLRRRS